MCDQRWGRTVYVACNDVCDSPNFDSGLPSRSQHRIVWAEHTTRHSSLVAFKSSDAAHGGWVPQSNAAIPVHRCYILPIVGKYTRNHCLFMSTKGLCWWCARGCIDPQDPDFKIPIRCRQQVAPIWGERATRHRCRVRQDLAADLSSTGQWGGERGERSGEEEHPAPCWVRQNLFTCVCRT